ncbi:MAG: TolC family protein, partial [Lentimicrobium sp.]|nr:TolC family protein [Lentimicrobium sp.]
MKTRIQFLMLILALCFSSGEARSQSLQVSPELKELIDLSVMKDYKIADKVIDKQIAETQRKAVLRSYVPKLELGGKYLYASSTLNSEFGQITGFESISKLQEFMANPAFPAMFPNLAGLSSEIMQLQQFLGQQGMQLPSLTNELNGSLNGNYYGIDASAKMLLFSGGQVPNVSKALSQKMIAQEALSDKCTADVISEVIMYYDQLALLNQSKQVLDESTVRLDAEKKYAASALRNGFATSFDSLKIAVAEASLQARQSEYESKKTLLNQKLAQLTGKPVSSFEMLNPDLQLLIYTRTSSTINNRPELRALEAGAEAQKYMLKSEKSHYLPKVQAVATARYDNIFNANTD